MSGINGPRIFVMNEIVNQNIMINVSILHFLSLIHIFTGGRNFKVQFENKVEPEQIRELISSKFGDANVSVIAIGTDGKTCLLYTS